MGASPSLAAKMEGSLEGAEKETLRRSLVACQLLRSDFRNCYGGDCEPDCTGRSGGAFFALFQAENELLLRGGHTALIPATTARWAPSISSNLLCWLQVAFSSAFTVQSCVAVAENFPASKRLGSTWRTSTENWRALKRPIW